MKTILNLSLLSLLMLLAAGCGTTHTQIYDPESQKTGLRSTSTVSSEELREAAQGIVEKFMASAKFSTFLKKYQIEQKDENAIPVLMLENAKNETNDPDLNIGELTDILNEVLIETGKVDVTRAAGAGRSNSTRNARQLTDDDLFNQKTVLKNGTAVAPRLAMESKVTSNEIRDGNSKAVVRTVVIKVTDMKTGLTMGQFTKQLGFTKKKSAIGW